MSKDILIYSHNHFDPTWRRCFDRPAVYNGQMVRSYVEIEEHVINGWLGLAGRGLTFSEGQTAVWRRYLERNPARRHKLKAEVRAGRLDIMQAGEVVQDSNMPAAEGLVRNFLQAQPLYDELAGPGHAARRMAWLEDAFGNSANYPQVLRGLGCEVACSMAYRQLPDRVWVGIDGTAIPCADKVPYIVAGCFAKHPPCPACRGNGCPSCRDTGLAFAAGVDAQALRRALEQAAAHAAPWCVVGILSEEMLPGAYLLEIVAEFNRGRKDGCRARWSNPSEMVALAMPELVREAGAATEVSPDLNPAMPGCLVSRIRCKQRTRAAAYALIRAEARLASELWAFGRPAAPPPELGEAWRLVVFNQFHDAITGTHVDSAFRELMDMLDRAEAVARTFGAEADTPVLASEEFRPVTAGAAQRQRFGKLDVLFDRAGIIRVRKGHVDLFGEVRQAYRTRRPLRMGELLLDADFGDAWGQRLAPFSSPQDDQCSIALGDYHVACERSAAAIRWHGSYTGGDPKVKRLEWTVTVRASGDGERLDFTVAVNWDTGSRRLRAVIPVNSQETTATYEIPYGFIERAYDPAKLDYSQWKANTMEFPTLHWGMKRIGANRGIAVLNKGLPCYRWMPGRWDISLLRSPEWNFCAVEPQAYEFWDIDGQRDTGEHLFEFSVLPFSSGLTVGDLTRSGYAYNGASPAVPFKVTGDVVVTAWKPAEDGTGWVLRLQDAGGTGTRVAVDFGKSCCVCRASLLEAQQEPCRTTRTFRGDLHKHGILTLLIKPACG